jgi:hypothetical protein
VHLQLGENMTDGKITSFPISEIHSEEGALELVRSERMKPYLAFLKAQMAGQDTEPYLAALAVLPLEARYVWRVVSALKWAFCDLDTENAIADVRTLSEEDLKKVVEPLSLRAILPIRQRADWGGSYGTNYAERAAVRKVIIHACLGRVAGPCW